MQEAKFSLNIRFNFKGYDSQFTMRDDENGAPLLDKFALVITRLEQMGALPERRWEGVKANGNGNGSGHAEPPKAEPAQKPSKPTCKHCDSSERMELVTFTKEGVERKAWKCQACDKWHYEKKGKK